MGAALTLSSQKKINVPFERLPIRISRTGQMSWRSVICADLWHSIGLYCTT
jgi:hypothetical protein